MTGKGSLKIGNKYFYIIGSSGLFETQGHCGKRALRTEPRNAKDFVTIFNTLAGCEWINPKQIGVRGAPVKKEWLGSSSDKHRWQVNLTRGIIKEAPVSKVRK